MEQQEKIAAAVNHRHQLADHWALVMKKDSATGRKYAAGFKLSR